LPPGVARTTVIVFDPAANPVVSHVRVSGFVDPGLIVSLIGVVTLYEPQSIQTEKFPSSVPVLFSLTEKVTACPATGDVVEGVTETMTMLAFPVLMVTWTVCVMGPLVPVMVKTKEPAALCGKVTESVDEFVPPLSRLTLVGLNEAQEVHEGEIEAERATVPEKPLRLWKFRVVVPVCPAKIVRLVGVDVRLKLGVMNVTCVVWVIVE
jgi:hypothetical protein